MFRAAFTISDGCMIIHDTQNSNNNKKKGGRGGGAFGKMNNRSNSSIFCFSLLYICNYANNNNKYIYIYTYILLWMEFLFSYNRKQQKLLRRRHIFFYSSFIDWVYFSLFLYDHRGAPKHKNKNVA